MKLTPNDRKCMIRALVFIAVLTAVTAEYGSAVTSIKTDAVNKSVVFFFAADPSGQVMKDKVVGTGFLIRVPAKSGHDSFLLVTARHIVDPEWAGCGTPDPARIFLRVNKKRYDRQSGESGVNFVPIDLIENGSPTWKESDDDYVDVAVLRASPELLSNDNDIIFLNFRNFGTPEEIATLGISSQTASTGLVPGLEGKNRNFPVFHFGKIASIPDETIPSHCKVGSPPRELHIWLIATTLVPGTSGSPIFFDPLFPPGGAITDGEPRAIIIGLQSISFLGADLAGVTPAKYIIDVISHVVPADADLSLGIPQKNGTQ